MSERVDDSDLVEAMGLALLRGGANATKAPSQIAFSVCPACKVARQNAAGVELAVSPAVFERAACDAVWLGNMDGPTNSRRAGVMSPTARALALTGLGFKKRDASCAVAAALEKDEPQDLDGLVRSALKRCGS